MQFRSTCFSTMLISKRFDSFCYALLFLECSLFDYIHSSITFIKPSTLYIENPKTSELRIRPQLGIRNLLAPLVIIILSWENYFAVKGTDHKLVENQVKIRQKRPFEGETNSIHRQRTIFTKELAWRENLKAGNFFNDMNINR